MIEKKSYKPVRSFGYDERLITAGTVKNKIMKQYLEDEETICWIIAEECAVISLTLDCWSSANGYSFLTIVSTWMAPDE